MIGNEWALEESLEKEEAFNVLQAVKTVKSGLCKRVDVNDKVKVYACKNVIRIDIKCEGIL